jgi:hypothetical protein
LTWPVDSCWGQLQLGNAVLDLGEGKAYCSAAHFGDSALLAVVFQAAEEATVRESDAWQRGRSCVEVKYIRKNKCLSNVFK